MKRPYCVGLTGGAGAGKSMVSALFSALGVEVLDTDVLARDLTAPGGAAMPLITGAFGTQCLLPDGGLDRLCMRARIFKDARARQQLESILHPMIRQAAERGLARARGPYVLLVVPLLMEHWDAYRTLVDRIAVVDCEQESQLQRLMVRPGMTMSQARAMLAAQASRRTRLARADDVIVNDGPPDLLGPKVAQLHDLYSHLAGKNIALHSADPLP